MSAETLMCDKFPDRPAVARFVGCGTEGLASSEYMALLRQIAQQTEQPLEFVSLPVAPDPLTRDERTQLLAARMSAEAETEEVKARNRDLYNLNTDLKAEVRRLNASNTDLEGKLVASEDKLDGLKTAHGELLAEHAELKQQHSLLQASVSH